MRAAPSHPSFNIIDVLTRADSERVAASDAIGERLDELDALLVSDLVRVCGRVGQTHEPRSSLVDLCAIVRALDATESGHIDVTELRAGMTVHAARTDRFSEFGEVRVVLRTLLEVVDTDNAATRGAIRILHRDLREWLLRELTGSGEGEISQHTHPRDFEDQRSAWMISEPQRRSHAHDLVDDVLHGAHGYPVTGILGAAWRRGWSAVPVMGEFFAERDPAESDRLLAALVTFTMPPHELLLINLQKDPLWRTVCDQLIVGDGYRSSWWLPADRRGMQVATAERRGWCMLTTDELDFAIIERAGYHAVLGPSTFVAQLFGMPAIQAVAQFREQVELLGEEDPDGDPPSDLLTVAQQFGRLRRRSR